MSRSWEKGSTRAWRKLRAQVLDRDGWRCQVEVAGEIPLGTVKCMRFADTAGHIISKHNGGQDVAANLRAECRTHNFGRGAKHDGLAARALGVIRHWTWA